MIIYVSTCRLDNMTEWGKELREAVAKENKQIRDQDAEE